MRNELNLKVQTKKLEGLMNLSKHCGWILPHENICWASERPCILNTDENGRTHSTTEAAISYPDGWSIYAIHGVRVKEYIILRPHEITIEKIDNENNVEIRRVMIERFGLANYIENSGAKLIHKDNYGELYKKELPDDEPIIMVKVINSTPEPNGEFKSYFLRVPPDIEKSYDAVAWTFGFESKEYNPLIET